MHFALFVHAPEAEQSLLSHLTCQVGTRLSAAGLATVDTGRLLVFSLREREKSVAYSSLTTRTQSSQQHHQRTDPLFK